MLVETYRDRDPWIVRSRPNPRARLRLFCFPFAGGGASTYRGWPAHLPADIEAIAVQLPGREERLREPAFTSPSELCARLVAVLASYFDRPFGFFGHSMGALLAFELTRMLRTTGGPSPAHLFVSAHCGPKKPPCLPSVIGTTDRELWGLVRRLGGTRDEVLVDDDLMRLMLPLLRADLTMCETYRYVAAEQLDCPISAFGGTLDAYVRRADLLAWSAETHGAFQARMFPGGHFFLDDVKPRLLQAITDDLAASGGPARAPSSIPDGGFPS
ncbi:MAG TPA: alpha/beta fold hydrolase [Kofleriaceae bacterium]|jgi:medium-chain acyl-[acyl-carrier-protein] hydrolase|nr:alpha/beta fold hydrolase [Kofleriaceae bacterium]